VKSMPTGVMMRPTAPMIHRAPKHLMAADMSWPPRMPPLFARPLQRLTHHEVQHNNIHCNHMWTEVCRLQHFVGDHCNQSWPSRMPPLFARPLHNVQNNTMHTHMLSAMLFPAERCNACTIHWICPVQGGLPHMPLPTAQLRLCQSNTRCASHTC
jgi:hypothetical protein